MNSLIGSDSMKQYIKSYINTIDNDLYNISKYIYENPESSFNEYKACNYLTNILKQNNFKVKDNFIDISTSFFAEYGYGFPKICFICEYDAFEGCGHLTGHNLISSMSIGAALSLSKAVSNLKKGSVVVIGCPGEFKGSSKVTMVKQGVFKNIDAVLMAHPNTITMESGTSMATIPLKITYKSQPDIAYKKLEDFSALDACILTLNILNLLNKKIGKDTYINSSLNNHVASPLYVPSNSDIELYIRGSKMDTLIPLEEKIRSICKFISDFMDVDNENFIFEMPYDELITNDTLSRIFSHNLKEAGIIDISPANKNFSSLSIGSISKVTPCIHPYISITKDISINYLSNEFAKATISSFAHDVVLKTSQALALSGLDLIQRENLINEMNNSFHH
ncbi:M20 family peptidase [Clostridium tetani]|nr:amidohydrolase [Clostridium tetani]RXI53510.1 M20 family peptidase [Clostridium tetani]RXI74702.1 M20 family peptidase [Clostridium tetani]RXI77524.1 M20 family peptidase [Clostridium tetani]